MNWEAINSTAEIVGAVGVIVSLIYLAIQVRKNTKQEEFQSLQSAIHLYLNNVDRATGTSEDAALFRKGLNDFESLLPAEQGEFHSRMHSLLHGFHGVWVLYKAGLLPEYELVAMRRIFVELLLSPGGRQWWEAFKHIPPQHLITYLEGEVERVAEELPAAIDTYPWLRGG